MCRPARPGHTDPVSGSGYPSPEEAALAEWASTPAAKARVTDVRFVSPTEAVVTTDTEPSEPYNNLCVKIGDLWYWTGGSN